MAPKPPLDFFFNAFSNHIAALKQLKSTLPDDIPIGMKEDYVSIIFGRFRLPTRAEDYWGVFNYKTTNCLPNILRGELGMDMVVQYLWHTVTIKPDGFPWSTAMPKVLHLVRELKALNIMFMYLFTSSVKGMPVETTPSTHKSTKKRSKNEGLNSNDDSDYAPPKRQQPEDETDVPSVVFNSDGEEVVEESDLCSEQLAKVQDTCKNKWKTKVGHVVPLILVRNLMVVQHSEKFKQLLQSLKELVEAQQIKACSTTWSQSPLCLQGSQCVGSSCASTVHRKNAKFNDEKTIPTGINNLATHLTKCMAYQKRKAKAEQDTDVDNYGKPDNHT
ncbi:hypothetical protein BDQ17DRAFT_1323697 [Cyathus striatus]|nr:hypothetical protein BDQ17DRAFT_1323697 [Cyathus striatus]